MLKQFILKRNEDVSGMTGTGEVAEGVVLSNGKAIVSFHPSPQCQVSSIIIFNSIEEVEAVHGHNGRTHIVFVDMSAV